MLSRNGSARWMIFAACWLWVAVASGGELPLNESQVKARGNAKAELKNKAVELSFDDPRRDSAVRLLPPNGGKWDFSAGRFLAVDVENRAKDVQMRLTMHIRSENPRDAKKTAEAVGGIALNPGEKRTLRLFLPHYNRLAAPQGLPGIRTLHTDRIDFIDFQMQWPFEGPRKDLVNCLLSRLRLEGDAKDIESPPAGDAYFPFIDVYGQYVHADWPDKIRSDDDLARRHADELKELDASKRPAAWNRFGGWADGPTLEATGHFRVQKHEGKWWLVDPEGKLFFSQGIDVLIAHTDATAVKDREKWFADPAALTGDRLAFTHNTLKKKYGKDDYAADFYATLAKRLEHWGMNTIGDWGKPDLMALGEIPYTLQLSDYNWGLPRIQGSKLKFYDVFHSDYARAMKTLIPDAALKNPMVLRSLEDPMCIGYFIDNELNFGNRGRLGFPDDVIRSPAAQPAKKEWLADLKVKYLAVDRLNAAWKTEFKEWRDFLANDAVPSTAEYKEDAKAFHARAVDRYFSLCREAVKTVAPHRLYLGTRFISTDAPRQVLADASAKYCDVLTFNVYAHNVANFENEHFPDMPVLVGEFHFGVYDRGKFSPGLCQGGVTQAERAMAYRRFVQGALANPRIVGTHWFQMRDQPLTGRGDGENYAIGFIDIADTPYPELIEAARDIGENMYAYRARGILANDMK